ncbi:MAG: hypothetical protein HUJ51_01165 [Eggerthellaceae bacterium]|nr:hypothetical protein [Eggerthellaceae bacterium]
MDHNTLAYSFPEEEWNKCNEVKVALRTHKEVKLMFGNNSKNFNLLKFESKENDNFIDFEIKMAKDPVSDIRRYSSALCAKN